MLFFNLTGLVGEKQPFQIINALLKQSAIIGLIDPDAGFHPVEDH